MRTSLTIALCIPVLLACKPDAATVSAAQVAAPPFQPRTTLKQTMEWIIEPNADVIWQSVGTIITKAGTEERVPSSEAEWERVRNSAALVAEAGNLLMMDGRALDRGEWMNRARAMIDAATAALDAAEEKDAVRLLDVGATMYETCTACHSKYIPEMEVPVTGSGGN